MRPIYNEDSGAYAGEIPEAPHTYNAIAYHGGMNEHQLAISETTFGGKWRGLSPTDCPPTHVCDCNGDGRERLHAVRVRGLARSVCSFSSLLRALLYADAVLCSVLLRCGVLCCAVLCYTVLHSTTPGLRILGGQNGLIDYGG